MKSPSPELLERIAQDQKAEHLDAAALAKENLSFWRQQRGGIDKVLGGGRRDLSSLKLSYTSRNILRNIIIANDLLRAGVSVQIIADYLKCPKKLISRVKAYFKRTELPKILQERAKRDERAGA